MALIDQIIELMSESKKSLHVNDIADAIIKKYPNISNSSEDLAAKVLVLSQLMLKRKVMPYSQSQKINRVDSNVECIALKFHKKK